MASTRITDKEVELRLKKIEAFLDANENEKVRDALDRAWNVYEYWCITPENREGSRKDLEARLLKLEGFVRKAKDKLVSPKVPKKPFGIDWHQVEGALIKYIIKKFHDGLYLCEVDDSGVGSGGVFSTAVYIYKDKAGNMLYKGTLVANCQWADAPVTTTAEAVKVGKNRLDEDINNIIRGLDMRVAAVTRKKVYKTDILDVYRAIAAGQPQPYRGFVEKFGIEVAKALEVVMGFALSKLRGNRHFNSPAEVKKFYLDSKQQAQFLELIKVAGFEYSERGKRS